LAQFNANPTGRVTVSVPVPTPVPQKQPSKPVEAPQHDSPLPVRKKGPSSVEFKQGDWRGKTWVLPHAVEQSQPEQLSRRGKVRKYELLHGDLTQPYVDAVAHQRSTHDFRSHDNPPTHVLADYLDEKSDPRGEIVRGHVAEINSGLYKNWHDHFRFDHSFPDHRVVLPGTGGNLTLIRGVHKKTGRTHYTLTWFPHASAVGALSKHTPFQKTFFSDQDLARHLAQYPEEVRAKLTPTEPGVVPRRKYKLSPDESAAWNKWVVASATEHKDRPDANWDEFRRADHTQTVRSILGKYGVSPTHRHYDDLYRTALTDAVAGSGNGRSKYRDGLAASYRGGSLTDHFGRLVNQSVGTALGKMEKVNIPRTAEGEVVDVEDKARATPGYDVTPDEEAFSAHVAKTLGEDHREMFGAVRAGHAPFSIAKRLGVSEQKVNFGLSRVADLAKSDPAYASLLPSLARWDGFVARHRETNRKRIDRLRASGELRQRLLAAIKGPLYVSQAMSPNVSNLPFGQASVPELRRMADEGLVDRTFTEVPGNRRSARTETFLPKGTAPPVVWGRTASGTPVPADLLDRVRALLRKHTESGAVTKKKLFDAVPARSDADRGRVVDAIHALRGELDVSPDGEAVAYRGVTPRRTTADITREHVGKITPGTAFGVDDVIGVTGRDREQTRTALAKLVKSGAIESGGYGKFVVPESAAR
jgi:hypothetical protein